MTATGTMKAALLMEAGKISVQQVPMPSVEEGSALIRVKACGICGSDMKFFLYGDRVESFPAILGHEIAGEVVEVGPATTALKVGDRIVTGSEIPCRNCGPCRNGYDTLCDNLLSIGTTISGGFCEYMLLPKAMIDRGPIKIIPPSLSYDDASLSEILACVVNAMEFVRMGPGKSLMILGTGPIGCLMVNLARVQGASRIVVADINDQRVKTALKFGAEQGFNSGDEDFLEKALDYSKGEGYDAVISACSVPTAHELAIRLTAKGGFTNLFGGIARGMPDEISFPQNLVHYRGITIGGTFSSTKAHLEKAVDLLVSGKIMTEEVITHKMTLDDIGLGFETVGSQQGLKVVINP